MSEASFIGIDLGTSHCAMASVEGQDQARLMPILQLEAPYQSFSSPLLPSVLYIPDDKEQPCEQRALPWDPSGEAPLLGRWAKQLATHNSQRAILSSKSWLCYGERREGMIPLLPARAPIEGKKTAREVARDLLRHLRESYQHLQPSFSGRVPKLVLTVPASFDLLAREWTEQAAHEAGWTELSLIEEPLAAFYAWLQANRQSWRHMLQPGHMVLVCDIGGGTCDFSLISVGESAGQLRLDRCAVGRHLLLGGDNMDLAITYFLQDKHQLSLDHWQLQELQQQARLAKEALLGPDASEHFPIALLGRGSQLFAQTISLDVQREEILQLITDGFFPDCPRQTRVPRQRVSGLQELGLPYEQEAAITRHLASFLQEFQDNLRQSPLLQERLAWSPESAEPMPWPTHLLLNGGVFHSCEIRERLQAAITSWSPGKLVELTNPSYDHAVAMGAAAYAAIQASGDELRVRSSAARSYYIGIASNEMAVPGRKPNLQGLCVLPQGTEEGQELALPEQMFGLCVGQEVSFRLFNAKDRAADQLGTLVDRAPEQLEEIARVSSTLDADDEDPDWQADTEWLPVYLKSQLTETGSLQLSMQHRDSAHHWQLNFDIGADR